VEEYEDQAMDWDGRIELERYEAWRSIPGRPWYANYVEYKEPQQYTQLDLPEGLSHYGTIMPDRVEHLQQIFQVAKKMNWINDEQAYHVNFGIVLNEDGTRLRSREGNTPKLLDLIIDSIDKSKEIMKDKNDEFKEDDFINLGVGSLKYSDLKSERSSDYKFSLDRMISFTGNTLCYIMYGYIRTKKILEKYYKYSSIELKNYKIEMNEINEKDINLLKHILSVDEIYDKVEKSNSIHHICIYLYDLVEKIHNCYKSNRVLDFDNDNNIKYINNSRALIFNMSKLVIEEIFKILNIQQLEFM
jgi:arginyl-tRNA synthetase